MDENVFNKVGSLTSLRNKLNRYGIYRFDTFNEIIEFKRNYNDEINECIKLKTIELNDEIEEYQKELSDHKNEYNDLIEERRKNLLNQIEENECYINKEIKHRLFYPIFKLIVHNRKRQNNKLKTNFETELRKPFRRKLNQITRLENLIFTYTDGFDEEIEKRTKKDVENIHYILDTLKELDTTFCGAIGEIKAVQQLSKLPKAYYIINDYQLKFDPPIYDKRNDDRIYSIQADHIVVGPTGVFIIETKNWNHNSINSLDLFSPVKQLKRSGFALFVYLNDLVSRNRLRTFKTHWGNKKISIKNVLLMTNATTNEKFQFVKVTTLDSVNKYITNHSEELDESQISELVKLLTF
jgi:hypothetical protein